MWCILQFLLGKTSSKKRLLSGGRETAGLKKESDSLEEKENKSERWMPWLPEAMKDVVSCDKARGSANRN